MPTFEEILKDTKLTQAFEDTKWMTQYTDTLINLPDEYLAEALRVTLMAAAFRLSGGDSGSLSIEVARHALDRVVELIKEGMVNQSDSR